MYKFKKYPNGNIEIFGDFLEYYNETDDVLECPYIQFTNCEMLDMDKDSLFLEVNEDSRIVELNGLGEVEQFIFPDIKTSNNIKELLDEQRKSIYALSQYIDMSYPNTHKLVNREHLGTTKLETLLRVAEFLDVDIEELYEERD